VIIKEIILGIAALFGFFISASFSRAPSNALRERRRNKTTAVSRKNQTIHSIWEAGEHRGSPLQDLRRIASVIFEDSVMESTIGFKDSTRELGDVLKLKKLLKLNRLTKNLPNELKQKQISKISFSTCIGVGKCRAVICPPNE
jgi:hypothetical protein